MLMKNYHEKKSSIKKSKRRRKRRSYVKVRIDQLLHEERVRVVDLIHEAHLGVVLERERPVAVRAVLVVHNLHAFKCVQE